MSAAAHGLGGQVRDPISVRMMFDVGTNEAYEAFIDEFVEAVQALFPECCIQWDFASAKCNSDPGALPKLHCQQRGNSVAGQRWSDPSNNEEYKHGCLPCQDCPADPELVKSLTTPDVTYGSLNENNPISRPFCPGPEPTKVPRQLLGYSKLLPRHGKPRTLKYAT